MVQGVTGMEKYKVTLTKEERKDLLAMLNRGKESAKKLTHARILLGSDEGEWADEKKNGAFPQKRTRSLSVGWRRF